MDCGHLFDLGDRSTMRSLSSILLFGIPLLSLGWMGIPVAAQSTNPELCQKFPQDLRCNLSAPSQVGQAPQPTTRPRVAVLDFDFSSLSNSYSLRRHPGG